MVAEDSLGDLPDTSVTFPFCLLSGPQRTHRLLR